MSRKNLKTTSPMLGEIEAFFISDSGLDRIRAHLNRFNPIKVMGMAHMEIRHSAILGWLLDPQGTHGFGDRFLKGFLTHALRGSEVSSAQPTALDVWRSDMSDAEIRQEWNNIDLLVLSPRNKWVFIIENKFHSSQHSNQLSRYYETIENSLINTKNYNEVRGIFLTLNNEEAEDKNYTPIKYTDILDLLGRIQQTHHHPLSSEVETFLNHYTEILEEATGVSEKQNDAEKLARELYREHRHVLDFIIKHGKSTEFSQAVHSVFGEDPANFGEVLIDDRKFIYSNSDAWTVSFLPESWYRNLDSDAHQWHGCENWWAGFPLITWLQLFPNSEGTGGKIYIYAEVGPLKNHDIRNSLISAIKNVADNENRRISFHPSATDEGKKYSRFLRKNSFPVDDIHDHEMIAEAMKKALDCFAPELTAIASVLPHFLEHSTEIN